MQRSSGRTALASELAAYVPAAANDARAREHILAFIATHEDCFERRCVPGHITGSAWVVDRSGRSALLTHHRKLERWLQLGGHADGDSDIRAVALREATEESGIGDIVPAMPSIYDLDVHPIPARGEEPAHLHYDIRYAFFADREREPVRSEESHAVAWIDLAEIERYLIDESVRRLVVKTPALIAASA